LTLKLTKIGGNVCRNGPLSYGNPKTWQICPTKALVYHFGRPEVDPVELTTMGRLTGPVVSGGWFFKFPGGTPKKLIITEIQVDADDNLLFAIPYPSGTTFQIQAIPPSWCQVYNNPPAPWDSYCTHFFRPVNSISEVRNAYGDAYYFDNAGQLLYIRVRSLDSLGYRFGDYGTRNANPTSIDVWDELTPLQSLYFTRPGAPIKILQTGSSFWSYEILVTSTNCDTNGVCPVINPNVPQAIPAPAKRSIESIPSESLFNPLGLFALFSLFLNLVLAFKLMQRKDQRYIV